MQSISELASLDRVLAFNFRPLTWIEKDWRLTLPEPIRQMLAITDDARINPELAESVNRHFKLHQCYHFDFETPIQKLALLDGKALQRLGFLAGLGLLQQDLRRVVEKDQVRKMRQAVSEEEYQFAMHVAPRLTKGFVLDSIPAKPSRVDFAVQANIMGAQCLRAAFMDQPQALHRRVVLKCPQQWETPLTRTLFDLPGVFCRTFLCKIAAYNELEHQDKHE